MVSGWGETMELGWGEMMELGWERARQTVADWAALTATATASHSEQLMVARCGPATCKNLDYKQRR